MFRKTYFVSLVIKYIKYRVILHVYSPTKNSFRANMYILVGNIFISDYVKILLLIWRMGSRI